MLPRAVVTAGGDGSRLGDLNPKGLPKSLILLGGAPLVSYQLEFLSKIGISEMLISFNYEWQVKLFKEYENNGIFPKLDYSFNLHSAFEHPGMLFRNRGVQEFLSDHDFIFTQGDLYLRKNIFKDLLSAYQRYNCSIITRDHAKEIDQIETILEKGFLKGLKKCPLGVVKWRYGGIYLIKNSDLDLWRKMISGGTIRTIDFFDDCLKENIKIYFLSKILSDNMININTPADYERASSWAETRRGESGIVTKS